MNSLGKRVGDVPRLGRIRQTFQDCSRFLMNPAAKVQVPGFVIPTEVEGTVGGVHLVESSLAIATKTDEIVEKAHVQEPHLIVSFDAAEAVDEIHVLDTEPTTKAEDTVVVENAQEPNSPYEILALILYKGPFSVPFQYQNPNDCISALKPMTWRFAIETTFFGSIRSRTLNSIN